VLKRALMLVEKLRPLASDLHLSVGELAIAYACSAPGATGVMVGASTPQQVEGWLGAGSVELAPSVREQLTTLATDCGFSPQADEDYAHLLKTIGSQKD
jgi:aryl-alcohol dehydrogenase-like predicted oxidoreductase